MAVAAYDPSQDGWEPITDEGFIETIGPVWKKMDGEQLLVGYNVTAKHMNRNRIAHGGLVMAMLDQAMAMASWVKMGYRRQATVQFELQLVSRSEEGDFVILRPEVVRSTRTLIFMRAQGFVGDRIIVSASGVWTLLPGLPGDVADTSAVTTAKE
jgi:acyl-coenzyme A thioesterase PaaI-like protein